MAIFLGILSFIVQQQSTIDNAYEISDTELLGQQSFQNVRLSDGLGAEVWIVGASTRRLANQIQTYLPQAEISNYDVKSWRDLTEALKQIDGRIEEKRVVLMFDWPHMGPCSADELEEVNVLITHIFTSASVFLVGQHHLSDPQDVVHVDNETSALRAAVKAAMILATCPEIPKRWMPMAVNRFTLPKDLESKERE